MPTGPVVLGVRQLKTLAALIYTLVIPRAREGARHLRYQSIRHCSIIPCARASCVSMFGAVTMAKNKGD